MKTKSLLSLLLVACGIVTARAGETPRVFLWSADALIAARASLAEADSPLQPALKKLRAKADRALKAIPGSVMDKTLTAASGDKHDYFSFGPYWWPDPAKPDGLPYIRRDGEINPATNEGNDDTAMSNMAATVETLAQAYWFTRDERYAEKAAQVARVWFLDPATRMNPNLEHAQAVPGRNTGRGIGIIESVRMVRLNESMALLENSPAWTTADRTGLGDWMHSFRVWLTRSPHGLDEAKARNNHGSWYDYQSAHLALLSGQTGEAKAILAHGLALRLARQVEPDGAQPLELARTKSLDYCCFNLEALFACAELASHVGLDWWHFSTADGRSLRAALAYLAPYADPAKPWLKQDIHAADRSRLIPLLATYLEHDNDPEFRRLYERFSGTLPADDSWRLIHHQPPTPTSVPGIPQRPVAISPD